MYLVKHMKTNTLFGDIGFSVLLYWKLLVKWLESKTIILVAYIFFLSSIKSDFKNYFQSLESNN